MKDIYQLKKGETYKVIKSFTDYDKIVHQVDETWVFDKITYLPYHSGLSLFVISDGINKQYRFQDTREHQEKLVDNFMNYVEKL